MATLDPPGCWRAKFQTNNPTETLSVDVYKSPLAVVNHSTNSINSISYINVNL